MHSSKDPLHGVTLEALLNSLVARYGWAEMARQVNINCFKSDPSIKSSLKFHRRPRVGRAGYCQFFRHHRASTLDRPTLYLAHQ